MLIVRKASRFAVIVAVSVLMLATITSTALAANNDDTGLLDNNNKYLPIEVLNALEQESNGGGTNSRLILENVMLPNSMNIMTPNVNMDKVINATPLHVFEYDFKGDLKQHGYTEEQIDSFTYEDYIAIEDKWKLKKEQIIAARSLYPELKTVDLSNWTNADFKRYYAKVDRAEIEKRFTNEQLQQLKQKGIRSDDLFYLFKEFHTVDAILAQSDDILRETIEGYYAFKLNQVTLLALDPTKYTQQNMPRYGVDWFLNSVVTSSYWLQIQSDRTLVALRKLYNVNFSSFNGYVTNMYGTYSLSQGGAHEGIDFAYGGVGRNIYAIFNGTEVLSGLYHQLSVYDANVGKTYNFLHMSSKAVISPPITNGQYVGKQGDEGNATGAHVHFEVQSGRKTELSPGNDHVLGSISPYQLHIYLGEL